MNHRRAFLKSGGLALLGLSAMPSFLTRAMAGTAGDRKKIMVVLFQRGQFSFVRGHSLPSVPRASRQWQTAVAIAQIVDQDLKASAAPRALFFHARRVSPGWKLTRVASIGNHIFYR